LKERPFKLFKHRLMEHTQPNNPLHGKTLEMILNELVDFYGWPQLAYLIRINCFANDPSIKSSLVFLRKTPWARKKVEDLYSESLEIRSKRGSNNHSEGKA
jgi:uncharacterized protein (DUF2132 family)